MPKSVLQTILKVAKVMFQTLFGIGAVSKTPAPGLHCIAGLRSEVEGLGEKLEAVTATVHSMAAQRDDDSAKGDGPPEWIYAWYFPAL